MIVRNIDETLTAVCRYYMEFLESDFKKNRLPSRRIELSEINGMVKAFNLSHYKSLNKKLLKKLSDGFESESDVIQKNKHDANLTPDSAQAIIDEIKRIEIKNEPERMKYYQDIILKNTSVRVEQAINIAKELINADHYNLVRYLKNVKVYDVFEDLFELWKNKQLLEKEEIYLYIYDITYQNNTFPIFYLQVSLDQNTEGGFSLEFSPVLMINKKALQFVSESYSKLINKPWRLDVPSRQIYFGNYSNKHDYLKEVSNVLDETTSFFSLDKIDLNETNETIRINDSIKITNNCHFALFDKSDEAILNDYEELLNMLQSGEDSKIIQILDKLGQDYLFGNQKSFGETIENEYVEQELSDKLVIKNPIPLNQEQVQVLFAINKPDCDRIIIHGPPGTGKSHTITAIIYDALLRNKSILVASDKKEALDVVEDKIGQVLDKMRIDDFLQNPILRLGKKDNNFNKIFKQANYEKIKLRYHAYLKEKSRMEQEIINISDSIKSDIADSIDLQEKFSGDTINWLLEFEKIYDNKWSAYIDKEELSRGKIKQFKKFADQVFTIKKLAKDSRIINKLNIINYQKSNQDLIEDLQKCISSIKDIKEYDQNTVASYFFLKDISDLNIAYLEDVMIDFRNTRLPIFGHLFSAKQVDYMEESLKKVFLYHKQFDLKKDHKSINRELSLYRIINSNNKDMMHIGFNGFLMLQEQSYDNLIQHIENLIIEIKRIDEIEGIPNTLEKIKYSPQKAETIFSNIISNTHEEELSELLKYLTLKNDIGTQINSKSDNFIFKKSELESRLILKMTNILDESVIYLRENHRNAVEDLRKMIKQKRKISTEYLEKLTKAFPCLIVNIRELGDYLPLEADLFDLVIIDEASQVSIAQAFPAIMRGKKIIVLGDDKQYSNVKSHNASIKTNNYYLNNVRSVFQNDLNNNGGTYDDFLVSEKINNFNVKKSILSFIKSVVNYECVLKKHFRGYLEIIGYSNEVFYDNSLQVMKIRGVSVDEVIRFHKVDVDDKEEIYKNANTTEAEFIIKELELLDNNGFKGTVGIITPFTNQQKLLSNLVYNTGKWEHYKNKLSLKIMTFDSCQGDEKDIIYFSMVEREHEDILKYIFPVSFDTIDLEEEGNLKAQRLNVGFSRAKESMVVVTSKNISNIRGEIGNALRKYESYLIKPDYMHLVNQTDPKSPVEKEILNYIYQTKVYKNNANCIEIIPQFGIGKYIKQIDPYATIPEYRVDFLFIFRLNDGTKKLIIIEYDGFEYHFSQNDSLGITMSERNLIASDIERQKTIESYGYPFIRLNKFNLTNDPIKEIDRRLSAVLFKKKMINKAFDGVNHNYKMVADKEGKICPSCKEIKPMDDFFDEQLTSKYGRTCKECKENALQKKLNHVVTHRTCAQCGELKNINSFKRKRTVSGYGRICSACIKKCPICWSPLRKMYNPFGGYYGCSNLTCRGQRSYID